MKRLKRIFLVSILLFSFLISCISYGATSNNGGYTIKFVSSDITNYPRVRLYYKIYDSNGKVVNNFKIKTVVLWEKIAGGEYLQREVRLHELLSEREGLSTSLVIDKSGSMNVSAISKIKSVLTQFVNSMNFGIGDKSELLVFDEVVETLSSFTNNQTSLLNAINKISKGKGRTALYNALYEGIKDAKNQEGARCVIGFTDGVDNESTKTVNNVISYSKKQQVPVYIVGAGKKLKEEDLKKIASDTGGKYWNINDLQEFYAILRDIYEEEKNSWYIDYITDPTIDEDVLRRIKIIVDDGNYKLETEDDIEFVKRDGDIKPIQPVQPVVPVQPNPPENGLDKDLNDSIKENPPKADAWYKTKSGLWYYFLEDGVTKATGWNVEKDDNQTYYLDPNTGVMAVGWTYIDGSWYYFNESHENEPNWYETGGGFYDSFGKKIKSYGSMFRDEMTPDGKRVDIFGKLVQ